MRCAAQRSSRAVGADALTSSVHGARRRRSQESAGCASTSSRRWPFGPGLRRLLPGCSLLRIPAEGRSRGAWTAFRVSVGESFDRPGRHFRRSVQRPTKVDLLHHGVAPIVGSPAPKEDMVSGLQPTRAAVATVVEVGRRCRGRTLCSHVEGSRAVPPGACQFNFSEAWPCHRRWVGQ